MNLKIKNQSGLKVFCKSARVAEITLYGAIGNFYYEDSISANAFADQLKDLPNTVNEIELRVNSPGGDVFEGYSIYNRLKQHSAKVTAYVDGYAGSIASLIIMAADEIVMGDVATIMIHKPWTMALGNSNELMGTIERLDAIEDQLISAYKKRTKLDRAELQGMLAAETEFNTETAIELGFADRKFDQNEVLDIAACCRNATWIKNKPVNNKVKDKVNNHLDNLIKEIDGFLARE